MSDSDGPKSKDIPSWQQSGPSSLPEQPDNAPPQEHAEPQSAQSRASRIEQASAFLEDDSIRDAPMERKKLFLESKGLTEAEIDKLLEIQHTPEAAVMEDYGIGREGASTPTTASPAPEPKPPPPSIPQERLAATSPKDSPPIITYPEFLLHAQQPAPLITADRLLTSLYIASGAAATIYGASKYMVEPMVESLTAARHSLFEGAHANIETLNKKLGSAASTVPEMPLPAQEAMVETDSVSSDGAGFFNRSAGTQTSPRLSRSNSSASSELDEPLSTTQAHTNALLGIHGKFSDLLPTEGQPKNPLGESMNELRAYLDNLPYANSLFPGRKAGRKGEVDAVANVKLAIRGVKGVLLSARNFPSGVAAR